MALALDVPAPTYMCTVTGIIDGKGGMVFGRECRKREAEIKIGSIDTENSIQVEKNCDLKEEVLPLDLSLSTPKPKLPAKPILPLDLSIPSRKRYQDSRDSERLFLTDFKPKLTTTNPPELRFVESSGSGLPHPRPVLVPAYHPLARSPFTRANEVLLKLVNVGQNLTETTPDHIREDRKRKMNDDCFIVEDNDGARESIQLNTTAAEKPPHRMPLLISNTDRHNRNIHLRNEINRLSEQFSTSKKSKSFDQCSQRLVRNNDGEKSSQTMSRIELSGNRRYSADNTTTQHCGLPRFRRIQNYNPPLKQNKIHHYEYNIKSAPVTTSRVYKNWNSPLHDFSRSDWTSTANAKPIQFKSSRIKAPPGGISINSTPFERLQIPRSVHSPAAPWRQRAMSFNEQHAPRLPAPSTHTRGRLTNSLSSQISAVDAKMAARVFSLTPERHLKNLQPSTTQTHSYRPLSNPLPTSDSKAAPQQGPVRATTHRSEAFARRCYACGSDAIFLCSGCMTVWYCSQKCQLTNWNSHAGMCKGNKEKRTNKEIA